MLLGPFDSDQRDDYRQMIEVNLLGAITATEVFLDQVKDGGGDIINISSVAGRTARSGNGSSSAVHGDWPSTRSCCGPQANSEPTRVMSSLSWGLRPASSRSMAAAS